MIHFEFEDRKMSFDETDPALDLFSHDFEKYYESLIKYVRSCEDAVDQRRLMMNFVQQVFEPYLQVEACKEKRLASLKLFKKRMIQGWVDRQKASYLNDEVRLDILSFMGYDPIKRTISNPFYYFLFNYGTKHGVSSTLHTVDNPTRSMKHFCKLMHQLYNQLSPIMKKNYLETDRVASKLNATDQSHVNEAGRDDSDGQDDSYNEEPPEIPPALIVGSPIKAGADRASIDFEIGCKKVNLNANVDSGELIFADLCHSIDVNDIKKMVETSAKNNLFLAYFKKYLVVEPFRKSRQADLRQFKQAMLKVIRDNPQENWVELLDYQAADKLPARLSFYRVDIPAHLYSNSLFKFLMNCSTKKDKPICHNIDHPTASMSELLKIVGAQREAQSEEYAISFRKSIMK